MSVDLDNNSTFQPNICNTVPPELQLHPHIDNMRLGQIFIDNHLASVMKTECDFRNYLCRVLFIEQKFIARFDIHSLLSALEHTLHFRPAKVPTETFLKSQRLWIMQKLLSKMGFGETLTVLMKLEATPSTEELRSTLCNMLSAFSQHLIHPESPPLYTAVAQMAETFETFCTIHSVTLQEQKQKAVERRCLAINWLVAIVINNAEDWIHAATNKSLEAKFTEWRTTLDKDHEHT